MNSQRRVLPVKPDRLLVASAIDVIPSSCGRLMLRVSLE